MRAFAFHLRIFAELLFVGVPVVAVTFCLHAGRAIQLSAWFFMAAWLVGGCVLLAALRPLVKGLGMELICRNCKHPLDEDRIEPTCPHCGRHVTVRDAPHSRQGFLLQPPVDLNLYIDALPPPHAADRLGSGAAGVGIRPLEIREVRRSAAAASSGWPRIAELSRGRWPVAAWRSLAITAAITLGTRPPTFRITIRDVLWLMVVAAVLVAWWIDHSRLKTTIDPFGHPAFSARPSRRPTELFSCPLSHNSMPSACRSF